MKVFLLLVALFSGTIFFFLCFGQEKGPQERDLISCNKCHENIKREIDSSVHRLGGLNCVDCHGGDPTTFDPLSAMDRLKGWRPRFTKSQSTSLCISCHADRKKMEPFGLQATEYANYLKSKHGKGFSKADPGVPVCVTCHGYHRILSRSDPTGPTFPKNAHEMICRKCHGDRKRMQRYNLPSTTVDDFKMGAHAEALRKNHPEMPGCIACHGPHLSVKDPATSCENCHPGIKKSFLEGKCRGGKKGCMDCHHHHATKTLSFRDYPWICMKCHQADSSAYKNSQEIKKILEMTERQFSELRKELEKMEDFGFDLEGLFKLTQRERKRILEKNPSLHRFRLEDTEKIFQDSCSFFNKTKEKLKDYHSRLCLRKINLCLFLGSVIAFIIVVKVFLEKT